MTQSRVLPLAIIAALCMTTVGYSAPQYGRKSQPPARNNEQPPKSEKPPVPPKEKGTPNEAKFLEKLDKADRDALQVNVGYLMPAPAGVLEWIGSEPLMASDFRDKVTVIQVVSSKSGGRAALEKLVKLVPPDVRVIGLHTPENADKAKLTFEKNPPCPVVIDTTGHWCDALGIWKRPVNVIIDKSGAVRFAGLNDAGLKAKLPELLAEVVDESIVAPERPNAPKVDEAADKNKPTEWPTFNSQVQSATDMRGKQMPRFAVGKWITAQPDPGNRLLAIDFWATWCPPCRASIPHLNELNATYGTDVLFVGLSDETNSNFEQGLKKYNLDSKNFTYSLALDPKAQLKKFFGISGIPHMAIVSPDGIVRWQGHPAGLQAADLAKLVAANKALGKSSGPAAGKRGWVNPTATSAVAY